MLPLPDDLFSWLDLSWFSIATIRSYDWLNPFFLYLMPVVPVLFIVHWLGSLKFRKKMDVAMFEGKSAQSWTSYLRFVPDVVFGLFMLLLLVALARPQRTNEHIEQTTEGIDIMLVLDTSGSMQLKDFKPDRLEAAKDVAENFIDGRFRDRIGIVVFAGEAYALTPLTTDYDLLRESIKSIHLGMIAEDNTAIGSALAVAINRMRDSPAKSKVIILISDGENTGGNLDPAMAAKLAHAYNIKVHTIGIGEDGRVEYGKNEFGETLYVETRLDESNLRDIAQLAEGRFYRATNQDALREIFSTIDKLEKTEIKENRFLDTQDYYAVYLKWGILLFLLWMFFKNTFITNALED